MKELNLSKEELLLLLCCQHEEEKELAGKINALLAEELNWGYILKTSGRHGISGIVYKRIAKCNKQLSVPTDAFKNFCHIYHKTSYINLLFIQEYKRIAKAFSDEKIGIIPLKGIDFVQHLFSNIGLRPMSDVDILVKKNYLDRAKQILKALEYNQKDEPADNLIKNFHSVFWRRIKNIYVFVELHWNIDFPDSPYRIRIADLWERSKQPSGDIQYSQRFSIEDNIIFNCFHLFRENTLDKNPFKLKNFVDLEEMIRQNNNLINWQAVIKRSEEYAIKRPVLLIFHLLQNLFHISIDLNIADELKQAGIPEQTIPFIIKENIFPGTTDSYKPASWWVDIVSEKNIFKKLKKSVNIFNIISTRYKYNYYSPIDQSVGKAIVKTTTEYVKGIFKSIQQFLSSPLKTKKIRARIIHTNAEMKKINAWLTESQR